jgi:hypothetical protein
MTVKKRHPFFLVCFIGAIFISSLSAETVYVDSRNGLDTHPGTKDQPVQTIQKAAELVNKGDKPGPTVITIQPGIYNLSKSIVFNNTRHYTEQHRLVIKAAILPDEPNWKPALMPIIFSTENPRDPARPDAITGTYGIRIKTSHVTIQGLKFLGSPIANHMYAPIERIGRGLKDLLVTQCLFAGDEDTFNIYCPVIATGDKSVVEHCIFHRCHASAVFWDGPEGVGGKNNAMRYCIVNGGLQSGVWTCQTADDFEYHHNIVTNTEYFWLRKKIEKPIRYHLNDCVIDTKYDSGYGIESGPTGLCGPDVIYDEKNIIRAVTVKLERNKQSRNYLHPTPDSAGFKLGAGLFKKYRN